MTLPLLDLVRVLKRIPRQTQAELVDRLRWPQRTVSWALEQLECRVTGSPKRYEIRLPAEKRRAIKRRDL